MNRQLSIAVGYLLGLTVCSAAHLQWTQLPPLPDREGFAGVFAGVSGATLLVAGGANFPEKKPWDGGRKVWHDTVYALAKPDGKWRGVGRLPHPLAYGVSVTAGNGLVCIGGSDAERHYAEVVLLTLAKGELGTKLLQPLPIPIANGAGALVESTVFVFGGSDAPGERSAVNRLFALDLLPADSPWKELAPCPGPARILSVAASVQGSFYVAGGAGLEPTNGQVARVYLRDAWRYVPHAGWQRLADLPKPSVAAPSPAPVLGATFFIVGGDDGSRVGFQPPDKHPGFAKTILTYDTQVNTWSELGEAPVARATLAVTRWGDRFVLPSGEARPGVRSPEVWTLRLKD